MSNSKAKNKIDSTVVEFTTPSEVQSILEYVSFYYLMQGKVYTHDDKASLSLEHVKNGQITTINISPLTGVWSEELPEGRLVLRTKICSFNNFSYEDINTLNSLNPDIKLIVMNDSDKKDVFLEKIFSFVGGVTINHFIETLLELSASQAILRKSLFK